MKKTFEYLRPLTPAEAYDLKARYGKKSRFWAGGTDLLLQWQDDIVSLDYCIDLSFIPDLDYISKDSDAVSIGSLTKVTSIEASSELNHSLSIIREAAGELATPQIRNTATIGGNLCHAAPSADLATPLIVLGAEARILGAAGERWVKMDAFFRHVNQTALEENELLTEIKVPIPPAETASCFLKIGRTVIDIAIVNMSARITMDDKGVLTDVRIAFGAVAPTPLRIKTAEEMLLGADVSRIKNTLIGEVSNKVANEIKPITDVRGTAEYRREISKVLTKRAIGNNIQVLQRRLKA
jgi:CO/xanthine dehydrogenase FAD-binding subunit